MAFIKTQTKLIVLFALVISIFLLGILIFQHSEQDKAVFLIEDKIKDKSTLVNELIALRGESLRTFAFDYSYWDDMLKFANSPKFDSTWAVENLDVTLATFQATACWVYNENGKRVYATAIEGNESLVQDSIIEKTLFDAFKKNPFSFYFINTSKGVIELRTAPIQPSSDIERKSEPKGYFAVARLWTEEYIDLIAKAAQTDISVTTPGSKEVIIVSHGQESKTGYLSFSRPLQGIEGKSVAVLKCKASAPLQSELASAFSKERLYLWFFAGTIMVLLGVSLYIWVSKPLQLISKSLQTGESKYLEKLLKQKTEFNQIGELIETYFKQRTYLEEKVVELKRIQLALSESEKRFRISAEQTGQMIYDWNMTTGSIIWAGAIEHITGYSPEEYEGVDIQAWEEMIHPDDRLLATEALNNASQLSGKYEVEYRLKRKDGFYIFVEDSGVFLFDDDRKPYQMLGTMKNITDRKIAEQELKASETLYKAVFENAKDAIFLMKGDLFIDCNSTTLEMYGCTREQIINQTPYRYSPENQSDGRNSMEKAREKISAALAGKPQFFEWLHCRYDGTLFDAEVSLSKFEVNNEVLILALVRDITKRKLADRKLRETERRLSDVIDFLPDATFAIDLDGKVMVWNRAMEDLTGVKSENILNKGDYEYALPFYGERRPALVDYALKRDVDVIDKYPHFKNHGEIVVAEVNVPFMHPDCYLLITASPLYDSDGKVVGAIESIRDITSRKKTENALIETESFIKSVLDSVGTGIIIVDAETHQIIDINGYALKLFGIEKDQARGRLCHNFICPAEKGKCPISDLHQTVDNAERVLINKNGEGIPILKTVTPVTRNGLKYFIESFIDISERKRALEQAEQLKEKLERAQRMESLGVLAGGVAHDLNNMLGPVAGFSELLLKDLPENSKMASRAQKIMKSAQDAAEVIQDLLTLARRGRYEMNPLELNYIVTSYLESPGFSKLKERHPNVDIHLNLTDNLPPINGSHVHLSKVIMNLVGNACEAMPTGGNITITTEQQNIQTLFSGFTRIEPGDYIVIRVKDSGVGIAQDDLAKIFEPYYSKKKMGNSGSGLGLSVVYGVVKDHNGYYDVFSEIGKGTEFVLYFPVCSDTLEKPKEQVVAQGGTEKVLVVDDSPQQRDLSTEIISSLGYTVDVVENGRQAVSYLKQNKADIIVLDMIMEADFDGLDTYKEIIKIHPNQKVIIVSGFSATERVHQMQELGAGAYIRKPYTIDIIARALREELDRTKVDEANLPALQPA